MNSSETMSPVLRTSAGPKNDHFGFFVRRRSVFDAARHNHEFARSHFDAAVAEFHAKYPAPDQKHLLDVGVAMPGKRALDLDELDLLAVQRGDRLGAPPLRKLSEFLRDRDFFAVLAYGVSSRSPRACIDLAISS